MLSKYRTEEIFKCYRVYQKLCVIQIYPGVVKQSLRKHLNATYRVITVENLGGDG